MSYIYKAGTSPGEVEASAFALSTLQAAVGDDTKPKLLWWSVATHPGYEPFVVRLKSVAPDNLSFAFINCTTGQEAPTVHTIDRRDRRRVWDELPSTLSNFAAGTQDCAFLFLAPADQQDLDLKTAMMENATTGGGQGKWPAGADLSTQNAILQSTLDKMRGLLRQILQVEPDVLNKLNPLERGTIEHVITGGLL
jgi:hypothetical protein